MQHELRTDHDIRITVTFARFRILSGYFDIREGLFEILFQSRRAEPEWSQGDTLTCRAFEGYV